MVQELFYAVMVEGKQTPSKLYTDYGSALQEASRLASLERKTAYVLIAVTKLEMNDIQVTTMNSFKEFNTFSQSI